MGVDQDPDPARCSALVGGARGLAPGKHGNPRSERGGSLGCRTANVARADDKHVGALGPVDHAEQDSSPARGLQRGRAREAGLDAGDPAARSAQRKPAILRDELIAPRCRTGFPQRRQ